MKRKVTRSTAIRRSGKAQRRLIQDVAQTSVVAVLNVTLVGVTICACAFLLKLAIVFALN